jgi:hypothetical protein
MCSSKSVSVRATLLTLFLSPALVLAQHSDEAIVLVADSRRFTGWEAWWINLYNESHLYFALMTIILIPALSLLMGGLTNLVMARIGINLKSRVLAER